jgi:hypothetical protein
MRTCASSLESNAKAGALYDEIVFEALGTYFTLFQLIGALLTLENGAQRMDFAQHPRRGQRQRRDWRDPFLIIIASLLETRCGREIRGNDPRLNQHGRRKECDRSGQY